MKQFQEFFLNSSSHGTFERTATEIKNSKTAQQRGI
jgi:hypothetical protein